MPGHARVDEIGITTTHRIQYHARTIVNLWKPSGDWFELAMVCPSDCTLEVTLSIGSPSSSNTSSDCPVGILSRNKRVLTKFIGHATPLKSSEKSAIISSETDIRNTTVRVWASPAIGILHPFFAKTFAPQNIVPNSFEHLSWGRFVLFSQANETEHFLIIAQGQVNHRFPKAKGLTTTLANI
jgi:hypothetical protein